MTSLAAYAGYPAFSPLPGIGHVHRLEDDVEDGEDFRVCTHPECGETKPASEFYVRTDGRLDTWCKKCQCADRVRRRQEARKAKAKP